MDPDSNPKIAAMSRRQSYTRKWQVDLMKTCVKRPGYCCFSMCCPYCASYSIRKQALYNEMHRYTCCNGGFPCSGSMNERKCPEFCLCMEVTCCFAQSVATSRWMIQDELQVETTACDNCIIGTMIFLQYLACIFHILACFIEELREAAIIVDLMADIAWCTVCACMQTQHKEELNFRDANPNSHPQPLSMIPPGVQMIPMGAQPPPPGYGEASYYTGYPQQSSYAPQPGYAPQAGYGAPQPYPPPQTYPPPQAGYPPPQTYPPPQAGYPLPQAGYPPPQTYPPQGYAPASYAAPPALATHR